ncbi:MAG: UbiA prenyltransferase family protein [Rhodopirellula sp.]|mgnify:CR=1 FL=1|nr:UbiA prenyltransferase family protein [Rhodopirellula sp.]
MSSVSVSRPVVLTAGSRFDVILPYVSIARLDHWFKNVFMLLGVVLAVFCYPQTLTWASLGVVAVGLVAACLVASSNYVLNEILDAATDRHHPVKCHRPIPAGRVLVMAAYVEWAALGAAGLSIAGSVNRPFFFAAALLWVMGLLYNIPPVRTKDLPYLDVLSESVNNPIRLLMGWAVINPVEIPPVSLLVAYWMLGAFFMASKRFAEYRSIADAARAGDYRRSFRHYSESTLLVCMLFYAVFCGLFLGVFIIRYHFELILSTPLIAGFFCHYLHVALRPDSPVQHPERLYRDRPLMGYLALCMAVFVGLMFVDIPCLGEWLNVAPSPLPSLWRF